LLTASFLSGFGAPKVGDPARDVSTDVPAVQEDAMAAEVLGPFPEPTDGATTLVAEYPPIEIGSLPVYRAEQDTEVWQGSDLTIVTKGEIVAGESLSAALRRQGISTATIQLIANEMKPVFDFRQSLPGQRYRLGQDPEGMLLDFRYSINSEESYYLSWEGNGYLVREDRAPLQAQLAKVSSVIESSLYEAVKSLGEQTQLAGDFADLFAWDIDFSRSVRPGDEFQILYERLYRTDDDGEEIYVHPGRILAARYSGGVGDYSVVYFENSKGRGGYYRPDGSSVEREFLVAPLEYSRISSMFSRARRHPILNIVRPHRGVDYAAALGTPLWSVADGVVIFRGWAGASGNLVKIKHPAGYVSYYAHLSRFEPGIEVGQRVTQKQRIGYVGNTGLSTGPHVCFRVQRYGHYVNPLEISSPAGTAISGQDWPNFQARRDLLLSDLGDGSLIAADEAL
jgi:murein DD-endopeptidase MepM/ murein hydrolase activator NlpD